MEKPRLPLPLASVLAFFIYSLIGQLSVADTLTYYAYPAPLGISWDTPRDLAATTVTNNLVLDPRFKKLHAIGHIGFDLDCSASDDMPQGAKIVTGQTSAEGGEFISNLLEKEYGLAMVLVNYRGRWETREEIEADLPNRFSSGRIAFIEFKITPGTCARVVRYLREYVELGYDRIYGGLHSLPRRREGAGCSAFGEAVLEIAGLMTPEWRQDWSTSVNIPEELVGGPVTGRHVSLFELFLSPEALNWKPDEKDAIPLTFWDPARTYQWIRKAWKKPMSLTGLSYEPTLNQRARGLRVDATQVATPTEGFWLN